jgi:flagellar FliL protein
LRVDFQLFGTVIDKDKGQLEAAMKRNKHRFRDQIIVEIRNSDSEDLNDSALGLIKRRILEKSNTLLGKPLLRSVVFSQFSYIEQ